MNDKSNTAFTHLNDQKQPTMVDVGDKQITRREALAEARVFLPEIILQQFAHGDIQGPKGPVFQTAILAGIMACKQTSNLIPLCHPLPLDKCHVDIHLEGEEAVIHCQTVTHHKTGVEMEALTGATVAALTLYDMCKALSHEMIIREVKLLQKSGGKSDFKLKVE